MSKPQMKPTFVIGLGHIPNDWSINSVNSLCTLKGRIGWRGYTKEDLTDSGPLVIGATQINSSNRLDFSKPVYISKEKFDESPEIQVSKGDIILVKTGNTIGKVAYIDQDIGEATINPNTALLKDIKCNPKFLFYVLSSSFIKKRLLNLVTVGAQPSINQASLKAINIGMPNPKEQQKIATILSSVDETIEKTEDVIDNLNLLEKGLMQKLLMTGVSHTKYKDTPIGTIPENWQYLIIDDVVKFEGGSQPPRDTFIFEPKEGYTRLIQIRDYKTDKYSTYVPSHLAKKFCDENDVMIGRYGPPIFQILRGLNGAYNVALIKAIPNEDLILQDYMYYVLLQEKLFRLIERLSQRTSGQTGIDMEALKNFPLPLPPIEEQQKIVSILNHNRKKIHNEEAYVKYLKKLKTGLMQQLLTGKVRVPATESEEVPQ